MTHAKYSNKYLFEHPDIVGQPTKERNNPT